MTKEISGGATLVAHCGARKITREELQTIPAPAGTRTHQPLSHHEIVSSLEEALAFRHLAIRREEYAVTPDGMRMFGVMDLAHGFTGCFYSIGLRNSNDKTMRLALTAGVRVTICDNMMFAGDFTPLLQKHSRNFDLRDLISIAVDRIQRNFDPLKSKIAAWQATALPDDEAKLVIYEVFLDRRVKLPRFLLPLVHQEYFKPVQDEFKERTLWSLSNAFTSAFKRLKPVQHFAATAKFGAYFTDVAESVLSERETHDKAAAAVQFPADARHLVASNEGGEATEGIDQFDPKFQVNHDNSPDNSNESYYDEPFDNEREDELMAEYESIAA